MLKLTIYGIKWKLACIYDPMSNSTAEKSVDTINRAIVETAEKSNNNMEWTEVGMFVFH